MQIFLNTTRHTLPWRNLPVGASHALFVSFLDIFLYYIFHYYRREMALLDIRDEAGMPSDVDNLGAPANSSGDDFGFIYNVEKRQGYVSSNRSGTDGFVNDDIISSIFSAVKIIA